MKKKVFLIISALLFSVITLSSCASSGPIYTEIKDIPAGKGLVYFYRESAFSFSGAQFMVYNTDKGQGFMKGKLLTILNNGSYYPFLVEKGKHKFASCVTWTKAGIPLPETEINVEEGETSYIKVQGRDRNTGINELSSVRNQQAQKEISSLKLAPLLKD